ncbi:cupin domain-containing protein [Paraburkholderia sp. MM5384-R2]|uniref:cupin domain-containing protein n=1 Tax=Paraburkholderia sp. MM5384-R2 TaxID=2723097 RepID=UPI001616E1F8|nr:DUF4437 domain-containing protein [Paraburkholderia sp. MM5384-R2]MBB5498672.1 quercetin dioxygenase-like cupin family protein [Paraburkholderia sp. MM5384-R2]
MSNSEVKVVDRNTIPRDVVDVPELNAQILQKLCVIDDDTGVTVTKICYKAGFTNVSHWHNCAHGMYVLDGMLVTSAGSFGPGSFVWLPEGTTMEHGAQQDNDVTCLFITNKPFDNHYTHIAGESLGKGHAGESPKA